MEQPDSWAARQVSEIVDAIEVCDTADDVSRLFNEILASCAPFVEGHALRACMRVGALIGNILDDVKQAALKEVWDSLKRIHRGWRPDKDVTLATLVSTGLELRLQAFLTSYGTYTNPVSRAGRARERFFLAQKMLKMWRRAHPDERGLDKEKFIEWANDTLGTRGRHQRLSIDDLTAPFLVPTGTFPEGLTMQVDVEREVLAGMALSRAAAKFLDEVVEVDARIHELLTRVLEPALDGRPCQLPTVDQIRELFPKLSAKEANLRIQFLESRFKEILETEFWSDDD
jgi:hypothetical protein